jgi:hypothetical protein
VKPGNVYQNWIYLFKGNDIKKKSTKSTNLEVISLRKMHKLNEVNCSSRKNYCWIKLDKKSLQRCDLMVKGGTVSDVLDNVPSVQMLKEM